MNKIERRELNPNEPPHAERAYVETTGDADEFLYLTQGDEDEGRHIVLSPEEARSLLVVISRWL